MKISIELDTWLRSLSPQERNELCQRLACEADFLSAITDQLLLGCTENGSSCDDGTINDARMEIMKKYDASNALLIEATRHEQKRINSGWQTHEPPEGKRLLFRDRYNGTHIGKRVGTEIHDDSGSIVHAPLYWREIP